MATAGGHGSTAGARSVPGRMVPGRRVPAILYDSPGTLERGTQGHFRGKSTTRKGVSPRVRAPIGWMAPVVVSGVPDSLERSYSWSQPLAGTGRYRWNHLDAVASLRSRLQL